ncbi:transmembrane protein 131-like isoform X1 [Polyodon spathula]|uniref:transmembrane protein 131-like isoform X1 n=1 Tax=Polyodon spathula TaxID=7913 RepID=UPI001B7E4FDB|nr:transmembrane protein 131-like isoform X1 [Polyodon spathula]
MANWGRAQFFPHLSAEKKTRCLEVLRILFIVFFHTAHANKEAFIQSDTILEVLRFGDGSLLLTESDIGLNSYHQKSASLHRGNCRPIRFEPPMLDFHEQPVGMPKMEKVYLHNPSSEETIILVSISATTSHFHASFFQNRIIPPGGNTSFDVVFLARVVGNVENTLFINTSHHGVFTYQVFGVGIPNPYRLRPFIGARVPVNSSFSPLINIHNPHSEPLQVVEMYSSGGDLHLELPTGQQGGTRRLWEIPPFETKGVMRASFSSRDADNHTAFIRIKTNASDDAEFIILPVEVEVTTEPGIYSSIEMLDFGTLRSQDQPKVLNLHLLNSGTKDVPITSVRPTPSNEAVTIDFKPITLKAGESKYTKVASISFDASKAKRSSQFSGKITVKAKEKSYSKLEIPYQADVLEGYLGFDHTATLFHIRDSPTDPVERAVCLTNTFNFAIRIHNVSLPEEAKSMFSVLNFSAPIVVPPHESRYTFSLHFAPARPSIHIDSNILLITNASKFHLPVRAYTGFLEPFVLPPSLEERFLDFSVLSVTESSSILFAVINSNPIELAVKSWQVIGESLMIELLKSDKGNKTTILDRIQQLQNNTLSDQTTVILASGYYAVFRVTLTAKELEGTYDGAIQITTDYEILTIPVKAVVAVGTLTSSPKHIVLPASFPGKIVHQSFNIQSSFSQKVKLQHIHSVTEDVRFYYKRLKSNKDELEPRRKSKVANIYFDARLQCGDHCYAGLPFLSKGESKPHWLAMQQDLWDADVDLYQIFHKRWSELKENSGHEAYAVFEVDTDLQKNVDARVTAQMIWPSIINTPRQIMFPLTNTNSSSGEEVVLSNPADVPVFVQVLPLSLYPSPSAVVEQLAKRLNLGKLTNLDTKTLEFQIHRNQTSSVKSSSGFVEGPSRPSVYNMILLPGEMKSFTVKFTPLHNKTVSAFIIVRNNLTVLDSVVVRGQGTTESLKVAGKPPGSGSYLRFKMTESLLKDCSDKVKSKEPNFTLRRTFKVENMGQLPVFIKSPEISGYACEGYGFKVVNCQEFALKPNASRDIVIMFTPDFTASRILRELKLITAGGSEFVFVLNASLPYHMLAACAEALPRPSWELNVYIIISLVMSSMFLLVIATAYLEAQGIWEPFQRRLSIEASNPSFDFGRPFDLRRIVGISSDGNLNEYGDSNPSSRVVCGAGGGGASRSSAWTHRQCSTQAPLHNHRNPGDCEALKSRTSSSNVSRTYMQAASMQSASSKAGSPASETHPALYQNTNRKLRTARQQHQAQQQQLQQQPAPSLQEQQPQQPAALEQQEQQPESSPKPPVTQPESSTARHTSEDLDYTSLLEAMDRDLERPESLPPPDVLQELPSSPAAQGKVKGKLQRKTKAQKKREEKERITKAGPQEDELKDSLADNDDSSSTTTETSNPDAEASGKEELEKKKVGPFTFNKEREDYHLFHIKLQNKKLINTKKENQTNAKSSCLELPYTTPLENKQRKSFTLKTLMQQQLPPPPRTGGPKMRHLHKQRASCGKFEDCRPTAAKFLSNSCVQELGNSSSSEGEKDSPPPEWDFVPLHKAGSSADSLHQISMQTMNADAFLKRPVSSMSGTSSPPLTTLNFSRGSYSSIVNASSENSVKMTNGTKPKLTKSTSLPGKNGNPTFAAVAAGYDKSPGGSGPSKGSSSKRDTPGSVTVPNAPSFEGDGSDSSALWSPIDNSNSPNNFALNPFSAFGSSNSFNLTGEVFSGIGFPKPYSSPEAQQTWLGYTPVPVASIWDPPASDRLPVWSPSSGSSTAPTASILGNGSTLWSSSTPFSHSIWSTSVESGLPFSTTSEPIGSNSSSAAPPSNPDMGRTYNPWSMWRPTLGRRSSEPWPNNGSSAPDSGD